jgi:hypothetical protein
MKRVMFAPLQISEPSCSGPVHFNWLNCYWSCFVIWLCVLGSSDWGWKPVADSCDHGTELRLPYRVRTVSTSWMNTDFSTRTLDFWFSPRWRSLFCSSEFLSRVALWMVTNVCLKQSLTRRWNVFIIIISLFLQVGVYMEFTKCIVCCNYYFPHNSYHQLYFIHEQHNLQYTFKRTICYRELLGIFLIWPLSKNT